MDKLMANKWFVRIASFVIAVLLFISANFELRSDKKSIGFSTSPDIATETIENVPVEVYYDMENLVVSGMPDNVDVTLKGAKALVTAAKNQRDFKVYVDLSDPNITIGSRTVTFKISDLNEKLVATIEPEYVEVNIQERVTKEFPVEAEYDPSALADGYSAEPPTVSPQTVKVTGAKETIEQISYVKAMIGLNKGVKETVNGKATVRALDRNLNNLDVVIEPASVNVTLPISIPSKTVKINAVQKGKAKDGIQIKSLSVNPKEVTVYGKEEDLKNINNINVDVDISKVTGNTELEVKLPQPDDVKKMSVSTVKVKVQTDHVVDEEEKEKEKENQEQEEQIEPDEEEQTQEPQEQQEEEQEVAVESKKLTNLIIGITGLDENQEVEVEPKTTDITLMGASQYLKNITVNDIVVTADVSQLTEGKHDVPLSVKVPDNVEWELSSSTATVSITQKGET
ncbi:CdaR family protein [Peribacillus asahii]|uniref:CdaR family protein n=1 Tax=Peribacillus asahii TaxID=228899 RepID=UPI0020796736|nr:CdaR family protein [Peribacillus asahii]USK70466.1 YbbR-like domain-containing protein [Peribacillus asahii]